MNPIQPIGAQIQPPNLAQGLAPYSTLLGIQQQKQNLQSGAIGIEQQQQQLSSQTAEAQQEQQKNRELQAASQLATAGVKAGNYDDGQGGLDRQKLASDLMRVAPVYGQPMMSSLLGQANEVMQNKVAHQNLTLSQKQEMGGAFGSLAADPSLDYSKFVDTVEKLRQSHPDDKEYSRMLTSMTAGYPMNAPADQQRQLLSRWSAAATREPQAIASTIDTGGQIIPGASNKFTGAFTPASTDKQGNPAGITKGLAPTEQPGYKAQLAGVAGDSETYTAARIADAHAPRVIALAQALQGMASQGSAAVANNPALAKTLRSLGVESAGVANTAIMDKLTATLSRELMAAPRSDADQHEIQNMLPDVSKGPEAVNAAADQIIQRAQYDQGKFSYMEKRGISNSRPMGAADAENQYTRSTPAPPTSRQAAPGTVKEGTSGKSKSGKPIVYRNGRWEYQQ